MEIDLQKCFRVLEIEPGAPTAAVKRAYRELVKVWHPDRFAPGSHSQGIAQEKLKEINEAYERLCKKRVPENEGGIGRGRGRGAETSDPAEGAARAGPSQAHGSMDSEGDSAERSERKHSKRRVAEDDEESGDAHTSSRGNAGKTPESANGAESEAGYASHGEEEAAAVGPGPVSAWRFWAFAALLCLVFFALWFGSAPKPQASPDSSMGAGAAQSSEVGPRLSDFRDPHEPGVAATPASAGYGAGVPARPIQASLTQIGPSPTSAGFGSVFSANPKGMGGAGMISFDDAGKIPDEGLSGERPPAPVSSAAIADTAASTGRYFTLGSTRDEVVAVQGLPDAYTPTRLQYGSSIVEFKNDRVESWHSGNPRLKARMPLGLLGEKLRYFTVGSRKDEVIAIQGEPDSYTLTTFHYGLSTVFFRNDRVDSWQDPDSRLKTRVFPTLPSVRVQAPAAIVRTMPINPNTSDTSGAGSPNAP